MSLRRWMLLAALLCAIAVSGCIEYEEAVTISDEKGAGTIRVSVRIAAHIASNTGRLGQYAPLLEGEEAARRYLRDRNMTLAPNGYRKTEERGMVSLNITAGFEDANKASDVEGGDSFRWRKNSQGRFEFRRTMNAGQPPLQMAPGEEQYAAAVRLVSRARLPRRIEEVSSEGPKADLRRETRSVTWSVSGRAVENLKRRAGFTALTAREIIAKSGAIFEIIKWGLVLLMVVSGYSCRLYGALGTLLAVIIANTIALNLFEPLANLLAGQSDSFARYADAVCYVVLFFAAMLTLQLTILARLREWITFHPNFDRLMSPIVGLATGFLLSGIILTFYFLLPFRYDFIQGRLKPEDAPASVSAFRHAANQFGGRNAFDPVGRFPHKYIKE